MLPGIPAIKKHKHRERKSMEDLKCSFALTSNLQLPNFATVTA